MSSRQCVPRIWALWSSFRHTGAGTFSLGLSAGVHVVFPWGAASWFGNKDKLSQELFSLCGYSDPGRWKHLPVTEWLLWTLEYREGKGEVRWKVCPHKQENSTFPSAKSFAKNKSDQEGTCPGWRGTISQGSLNSKGQNQEEKSWNQDHFRSG